MKKRMLALLFGGLLALSLCACGGEPTQAPADAGEDAKQTEEAAPEATDAGTVGDYEVAIKDCTFGEDYEGNKMIVVTYDFTNNSTETTMPLTAVNMSAFQDGVSLEIAMVLDNSVYDAGIAQKELKPGASLPGCQNAFVLTSNSPVEVEVSPFIGDPVLFKTFDVQ